MSEHMLMFMSIKITGKAEISKLHLGLTTYFSRIRFKNLRNFDTKYNMIEVSY